MGDRSQDLHLKSYGCSSLLSESSVALTPLQLTANTAFVLRSQRLIALGAVEVWKPPPCVPSSPYLPASWQPLPPPTASSSLPTRRLWLRRASRAHRVRSSATSGKRIHRKNWIACFSGSLGAGDVFVYVDGNHSWDSGWRDQKSDCHLTTHFFPEIKMGWGIAGKEEAFVRGRKGILLDGSWGKRERNEECYILVTQFFKIFPSRFL